MSMAQRLTPRVCVSAGTAGEDEVADNGQKRPAGKLEGAVRELAQDVATLCIHPVYISTIAGQTLYTGAHLASDC